MNRFDSYSIRSSDGKSHHVAFLYFLYSNVKQGKVIGWPSCIRDHKYARNEYLFNICFVCDPAADISPYETLVKKLSAYFVTLEVQVISVLMGYCPT